MDRAVRTECPVLAHLAGGPLIVAGAEFVRSTEVRDWAAVTGLVIDAMREITLGLTGSVPPTARVPIALVWTAITSRSSSMPAMNKPSATPDGTATTSNEATRSKPRD
jgi:hypothetical protein